MKTAIVYILPIEERAQLGGKDLNMKTYWICPPPQGLLHCLIQKHNGRGPYLHYYLHFHMWSSQLRTSLQKTSKYWGGLSGAYYLSSQRSWLWQPRARLRLWQAGRPWCVLHLRMLQKKPGSAAGKDSQMWSGRSWTLHPSAPPSGRPDRLSSAGWVWSRGQKRHLHNQCISCVLAWR